MEENKLLTAALNYASLGLRVHPLISGGKTPVLKCWQKQATQDKERIRAWWMENPAYNIGIATGAGLTVIDVDKHHDNGFIALSAYETERGPLPLTWRAQTPSGGQHLYYRTSGQKHNRVNLYAGIDVRGEGGYVVAPPSMLPNGAYSWVKVPGIVPLAEADQNVYTFLSPVPDNFDRQSGAGLFCALPGLLDNKKAAKAE